MEKLYINNEQIDNSLFDCINLIKNNLSGVSRPHIISMYRGSLTMGVKLSHYLNAPLSIIDYQTYTTDNIQEINNKLPKLKLDAGITSEDLLVVVEDICDSGNSFKMVEKYLKEKYPNNKIIFYSIVGSKKHPSHFHYSIEHNNRWVVFKSWEEINDTRCQTCYNGVICRNNPKTHTHCNIKNKSFHNSNTCMEFICQ